LVYIMHIQPSLATIYSLFIVGVAALVGSIKGAKDKLLDFKIALYFGLPSIVSIFIMRKFLVPLLPPTLFKVFNFEVSKDLLIMLVFAILMILASVSMIKKNKPAKQQQINKLKIVFSGTFVGLLTGFVGVGGGFLIIPTLIFSARLNMKSAVATSLIIIAFNSLIGFAGSLNGVTIDWQFLLLFSAFAIAGIFTGMFLSKKIDNEKLKPAFGWFVLLTGIYIIIKELIIK
jgi:uncharacterized membrane protein YfcA